MKKGRAFQLTAKAGEFLISAELCRRGFISTPFAGNVPEFDIVAIDESLKRNIPIQVKTTKKGGGWQSRLYRWCEIEFDGEIQKKVEKKKIDNPDLIYVMVNLGQCYGKDEFYLLRKSELQEIIVSKHRQAIAKHGGRRPQKPFSMHCAVTTKQLEKYKDNWKILSL